MDGTPHITIVIRTLHILLAPVGVLCTGSPCVVGTYLLFAELLCASFSTCCPRLVLGCERGVSNTGHSEDKE